MDRDKEIFDSLKQPEMEQFLRAYKEIITSGAGKSLSALLSFATMCEKYNLGNFALNTYRLAIESHPTNQEPYLALVKFFQKSGLYYSQKKVLIEMREKFPTAAPISDLLKTLEERFPHRTCTAYIPVYNVEKYIQIAIESFLNQSYDIDELLVIDDGSPDRSSELAANYPVKIIKHDENKGLAAARNTAINHASGEFIASVDTDAIPDYYWLERLILFFNDPLVAGVGGRLYEKHTATVVDKWRQVRMSQDHGNLICENKNLNGCNTLFRTDILRSIGGYNEVFRTNFEDMDISLRLLTKGYKTRYNPEAVCRHLKIDNLGSVVDTCYNWRKPAFEAKGAYRDIDLLKEKTVNDVLTNITDVNKLLADADFDILYPNYLSIVRTVFKDIYHFCQNDNSETLRNTFKGGYLILLYSLKDSGATQRLIEYLLEDIEDLARFIEDGDETCASFKQKVFDALATGQELADILSGLNLAGNCHIGYLTEVFQKMAVIFDVDKIVSAMVETSARRVRLEAANSPYTDEPKVMILNPPWNVKERRGVRSGSRWPFTAVDSKSKNVGYVPYPFFLGYLSSMLSDKGIHNLIVDGIAESLSSTHFLERVAGYEPDIILMEVATASYLVDTYWLMKIKERLPEVKVIWAGTHVSALKEKILAENMMIDFLIIGEFEQQALRLIEAIIGGEDTSAIEGVIARDADGKIVSSPPSKLIKNLDDLPEPERLLVSIYNYNDLFAGMSYPSLQVHASRGCPFPCIYCVWPQTLYGGQNYRTRSPEKVVDEIEHLVNEYGFKSVYFDDDTFNIGKERILKLCGEIKKRGLDISWGAMARADTSDYETLKAMKDSGLVGIKFGVESGSQALVDNAEKKLDLNKVVEAMKWCKELSIKTHLTFTFGLPGETSDTINETIDFAKRMNPESIQFSITTPFPGTKYYDMYQKKGNILTDEWDKFDGGQYTVIKSDNLTRNALEEAVARANREFWACK